MLIIDADSYRLIIIIFISLSLSMKNKSIIFQVLLIYILIFIALDYQIIDITQNERSILMNGHLTFFQ